MIPQSPATLDTKPIEWQKPDDNGKISGTQKVTAKLGDLKKSYIITISGAATKEEAEALLQQKIHEIVSVALLVNVNTEKSLVYKDGKYSTLTKDGENTKEKKITYLDDGYSEGALKARTEKAKNRQAFYEKIAPVIQGRNSEIDNGVQEKIKKGEKLTRDDLKKIDDKLKVEYFSEETDISELTKEVLERKIAKWKQTKELVEISKKIFASNKPQQVEEKEDKAKPTPLEIAQRGYQLFTKGKSEEERQQGVALLEQAAEKGAWEAHSLLCKYYYFTKKDNESALEHGLAAGEKGCLDSQNICIEIYKKQGDLKKELEMLNKGVAANNPMAHYFLAENLMTGRGIEKNEAKAKEHYQKVIENKDDPSINSYNKDCILASAYRATGQIDKAKEVLENAEEANIQAKQLLDTWFPKIQEFTDDEEVKKIVDENAEEVVKD